MRYTRLLILVLLAGIVLSLAAALPAQAQGERHTLALDGLDRYYELYIPSSYDAVQPVPLVIVLHEFGSSGKAMQALTGFDALAEQDGFIVAYPDSSYLHWSEGRLSTGWLADLEPVDDVGFITALIDDVTAQYSVDAERVYLAGFGEGGTMAYRLACAIPDRLAKVAVVGALMWDYHASQCASNETIPVSMLLMHGTHDAEYPVVGDQVIQAGADQPQRLMILSAQDTLAFWAERNGCAADSALSGNNPPYTIYPECDGGTTLAQYILSGVGHNWPRTGPYLLNQFGIDATEVIGRFFRGEGQSEPLVTTGADPAQLYGGLSRSYVLYVPPGYDPAQPMPLVVALHGRTDNGAGFAYRLDMNRVAQEKGFMIVYPDGAGGEWTFAREGAWGTDRPVDDTAFLTALVADLAVDVNIDPQRVYVLGFSNGGWMTQRLACEATNVFAAYAVISANLYTEFVGLCRNSGVVPMLIMHGKADQAAPWEEVIYDDVPTLLSVPDTVIFWLLHNGCDAADYTIEDIPPQDPSAITHAYRYEFAACANSSRVVYYLIVGGGHNIPGVVGRMSPDIAGGINTDIHAGEEIWAFFEQHRLGS